MESGSTDGELATYSPPCSLKFVFRKVLYDEGIPMGAYLKDVHWQMKHFCNYPKVEIDYALLLEYLGGPPYYYRGALELAEFLSRKGIYKADQCVQYLEQLNEDKAVYRVVKIICLKMGRPDVATMLIEQVIDLVDSETWYEPHFGTKNFEERWKYQVVRCLQNCMFTMQQSEGSFYPQLKDKLKRASLSFRFVSCSQLFM